MRFNDNSLPIRATPIVSSDSHSPTLSEFFPWNVINFTEHQKKETISLSSKKTCTNSTDWLRILQQSRSEFQTTWNFRLTRRITYENVHTPWNFRLTRVVTHAETHVPWNFRLTQTHWNTHTTWNFRLTREVCHAKTDQPRPFWTTWFDAITVPHLHNFCIFPRF